MNKIFTCGQALSLLGGIVLINEKLDALINDCHSNDSYGDLANVEYVLDGPKEAILCPHVSITLDYREAYDILGEALVEADAVGDLSTYQKTANLIASLSILSAEIEDKNKNRPGHA